MQLLWRAENKRTLLTQLTKSLFLWINMPLSITACTIIISCVVVLLFIVLVTFVGSASRCSAGARKAYHTTSTTLELFRDLGITKGVVWGHPLHSHTHSYIHAAFYSALCSVLGDDNVVWASGNKADEIPDGALVITEGQASKLMPFNPRAFYVLHNASSPPARMPSHHVVVMQVVTNDGHVRAAQSINGSPSHRMAENGDLFLSWGSDILPEDMNLDCGGVVPFKERKKEAVFVGTVGTTGPYQNASELNPFFSTVAKLGYASQLGGGGMSHEENIKKVHDAQLAPCIVGEWQKRRGYVPCRLFKNIAYGAFPATNSQEAAAVFPTAVFKKDPAALAISSQQAIDDGSADMRWQKAYQLVRERHTYINNLLAIGKCLQHKRALVSRGVRQSTPRKVAVLWSGLPRCMRTTIRRNWEVLSQDGDDVRIFFSATHARKSTKEATQRELNRLCADVLPKGMFRVQVNSEIVSAHRPFPQVSMQWQCVEHAARLAQQYSEETGWIPDVCVRMRPDYLFAASSASLNAGRAMTPWHGFKEFREQVIVTHGEEDTRHSLPEALVVTDGTESMIALCRSIRSFKRISVSEKAFYAAVTKLGWSLKRTKTRYVRVLIDTQKHGKDRTKITELAQRRLRWFYTHPHWRDDLEALLSELPVVGDKNNPVYGWDSKGM